MSILTSVEVAAIVARHADEVAELTAEAAAARAEGWAAAVAYIRTMATSRGPLFTPTQIADLLEALAAAPDAQTTGGNEG